MSTFNYDPNLYLSSREIFPDESIMALERITQSTQNLIHRLQRHTNPPTSYTHGATMPLYRPIVHEILSDSMRIASGAIWVATVLLGDFHIADSQPTETRRHSLYTPWHSHRTTANLLLHSLNQISSTSYRLDSGTMEDEMQISEGFSLYHRLPNPDKIPGPCPSKKASRRRNQPNASNTATSSNVPVDRDTTLVNVGSPKQVTPNKRKHNVADDRDSSRKNAKRVRRGL